MKRIKSLNENTDNLRVIKTARDKESINEAALNGYRPLVKKVVPSNEIRSKYAVLQHKKTGAIEVIGDVRSEIYMDFSLKRTTDYELVIDWTFHYPYKFKSPYAAYLIPGDIVVGERVFVEDLIEDYVGVKWNQGNVYRLKGCEAIWNGTDLEIQYDPDTARQMIIMG